MSGAKSSDRVTLLDPATGQITEMEGPPFTTPEAAALWKPLLAEAKNMIDGLAIDRDDNLYAMAAANRVLDGKPYFNEGAAGCGQGASFQISLSGVRAAGTSTRFVSQLRPE